MERGEVKIAGRAPEGTITVYERQFSDSQPAMGTKFVLTLLAFVFTR